MQEIYAKLFIADYNEYIENNSIITRLNGKTTNCRSINQGVR
jgi:hypothetical protein